MKRTCIRCGTRYDDSIPFEHECYRQREIRSCPGHGKFEGENILTCFAYETSLHGDGETIGDDNGGESYTRLNGPWPIRKTIGLTLDDFGPLNNDELNFLAEQIGCILHESTTGFVSATWFTQTDKLEAAWDDIQAEYPGDDDDEDEESGLIDPDETIITDGVRAEHFTIELPTDMVHWQNSVEMEDAVHELCNIAIRQVREECSLYRMPCTWTANMITEDISNVWECKVKVTRYSNASEETNASTD